MKPWQKGNYVQPSEEEKVEEVKEEEAQAGETVSIEIETSPVEEENYICPNCGRVFDSEKGLRTHLSRWCKGNI